MAITKGLPQNVNYIKDDNNVLAPLLGDYPTTEEQRIILNNEFILLSS